MELLLVEIKFWIMGKNYKYKRKLIPDPKIMIAVIYAGEMQLGRIWSNRILGRRKKIRKHNHLLINKRYLHLDIEKANQQIIALLISWLKYAKTIRIIKKYLHKLGRLAVRWIAKSSRCLLMEMARINMSTKARKVHIKI